MAPVVGRMRGRSSFRALARPDGRARKGYLSVLYRAPGTAAPAFPLVGYAIGRRHGSAVRRNRLRRRLREAMRLCAPDLPPGSYLVRSEPVRTGVSFDELCHDLRSAALRASGRQADRADRAERAGGRASA